MCCSPQRDRRGSQRWQWGVLLGCLLSALTSGFSYAFSIYGGAIKKQFHLSQGELDWIATIGSFCFVFSPIAGYLTDTRGPRMVLCWSGVLMTVCLCLQYIVASKRLTAMWPWSATEEGATVLLCAFACMTTLGANGAASVAFAIPVRVFPRRRGIAVGLVKTFAGLVGGLLAQIYACLVGSVSDQPETLSFLLFLAGTSFLVNVVVGSLLMPSLHVLIKRRSMRQLDKQPSAVAEREFLIRAGGFGTGIVLLIVAVTGSSIVTAPSLKADITPTPSPSTQQEASVQPRSDGAFIIVTIFVMLLVGIVAAALAPQRCLEPCQISRNIGVPARPLLFMESEEEHTSLGRENDWVEEGIGPVQMAGHWNAYLLLWTGVVLVGGGIFHYNEFLSNNRKCEHSCGVGKYSHHFLQLSTVGRAHAKWRIDRSVLLLDAYGNATAGRKLYAHGFWTPHALGSSSPQRPSPMLRGISPHWCGIWYGVAVACACR